MYSGTSSVKIGGSAERVNFSKFLLVFQYLNVATVFSVCKIFVGSGCIKKDVNKLFYRKGNTCLVYMKIENSNKLLYI